MASMNMEEQFEEQLESLSREDLVTLVRKLLLEKNEAQKQLETAQKQLETTKKEAGESAKQAEEFSQRNIQLEKERAKVHADLRQKLAEIEDMHKEMEEKSKDIAEKANQIDALLGQLNESRIPVSETSTIATIDLPPSSRVPLPLELNCEIFKCLKLPIQRKFIWGLGRGIYGMFGQKLLKKTKRVRNPHGNGWNGTNTRATVVPNGLNVSNNTNQYPNVFAEQPFIISGPLSRMDDFPGTILYYYEVKANMCAVGLSGVPIPHWISQNSNSYSIPIVGRHRHCYRYWLAGTPHRFELPAGAIRPERKDNGNVLGCGLILDSEDKLAIFFTLNGQVCGRKIPISPTVDRLFPAAKLWNESSIEANFGDDPAKPFKYDIHNCPGLELASFDL